MFIAMRVCVAETILGRLLFYKGGGVDQNNEFNVMIGYSTRYKMLKKSV